MDLKLWSRVARHCTLTGLTANLLWPSSKLTLILMIVDCSRVAGLLLVQITVWAIYLSLADFGSLADSRDRSQKGRSLFEEATKKLLSVAKSFKDHRPVVRSTEHTPT